MAARNWSGTIKARKPKQKFEMPDDGKRKKAVAQLYLVAPQSGGFEKSEPPFL